MDNMIDGPQLRAALAANISRLRKQREWSQEELSRRAGVSRIQLSRLENGQNTPGADMLFSLADAFGVEADSLRRVSQIGQENS